MWTQIIRTSQDLQWPGGAPWRCWSPQWSYSGCRQSSLCTDPLSTSMPTLARRLLFSPNLVGLMAVDPSAQWDIIRKFSTLSNHWDIYQVNISFTRVFPEDMGLGIQPLDFKLNFELFSFLNFQNWTTGSKDTDKNRICMDPNKNYNN